MNIRANIFGGTADEPVLVKAKVPKGAKADELHSIPVTRTETRRANTREDDRHRLADECVTVVHHGCAYDVELINLSGGGAMVAGKLPARLWEKVELRLGTDGVIECAVCWIKDDRFGIEFAQETRLDCSVGEQADILREAIARSFPDVEFEANESADEPVEPEGSEQRDRRRHPLIWSGILHHDFASHPIRLRNISNTGAMIECAVALAPGAQPLLELGEIQLPATVTWAIGDTAGLRFDSMFDLSLLARSRPEVAEPQWQRPSYLNGGKVSDSRSNEQWQRMSLGELRQELEGFCKR